MTEAGEAGFEVILQRAAEDPEITSILLRTITIAVYFFLFEHKKSIFAVFLPYKVFKKHDLSFCRFLVLHFSLNPNM